MQEGTRNRLLDLWKREKEIASKTSAPAGFVSLATALLVVASRVVGGHVRVSG